MRIRYTVLLPPLLPLLACAIWGIMNPEGMVTTMRGWSDWVMLHFDWLFNGSTFACLLIVVAAYISPLGRVKIGGDTATPLLSRPRWFAITVCTTIATGILFWGTAEPIYHVSGPPEAGLAEPDVFAMSIMYLHWTFTPYGMYTLGGLLFALAFYNRRQPFAISSLLEPLLGERIHKKAGAAVDVICLFALVAGMAGSLGAGTLSLSGGLASERTPLVLGLIIAAIVIAFSVSAASGLQRGIRLLSGINVVGFMLLAVFVFFTGPTLDALALSFSAAGEYVSTFVPRNLGLDPGIDAAWGRAWTSFYWAGWYAWAPVTALFLGRLGRGYTVRAFIRVNLLYTSLFGAFWMVCFAAIGLVTDESGQLSAALTEGGPEAVIYVLLDTLPLAELTPGLFLLLVFLSYVTAADSNISAMSALCVEGITPERQEAPLFVKLLWGGIIGTTAWVMVAFAGIDGIRLVNTLGGFPAMFLFLLAGGSLLVLVVRSWRARPLVQGRGKGSVEDLRSESGKGAKRL
ncbi:BCCT family transporter [Neolewinella agarilytica]|uniref:BCCT family transporter n=1 Tax=Neolewinella agarilytica TaxID=478744 RepID=UPI0023537C34|nr:BCCT family transporter [Neolewinella agarilytica]